MPNLTFRGAILRHFDVRRDEAGTFCRAHISADFSKPILEAMEWAEPMNGIKSANLDGKLTLQNFVFVPNGKELAQYQVDIEAAEAYDFQFHRIQAEANSESMKTELRFQIRTAATEAEHWLGQWLRNIGAGKGALKLNFSVQEAMKFDEQSPASKAEQGVLATKRGKGGEATTQ